jgi:molybdate transport system substrate-binding protein
MKRLLSATVLLCGLMAGCSAAPGASARAARTLTVFAAASLSEAFTELGVAFESDNPGIRVRLSFAGSQTLRTQIEEGAPADVFASANGREMDALSGAAFVAPTAVHVFATNQLVVIAPAGNPADLHGLEDLARPGLKLVLAAQDVPVGAYSRQALGQMSGAFGRDFSGRVLANVVSNEDNVKQVVVKVQLGEADAGIAYASDAVAVPGLQTIAIPDALNVIGAYPIAPVTSSSHADLAARFIEYVLSPLGQAVLVKWGFGPGG